MCLCFRKVLVVVFVLGTVFETGIVFVAVFETGICVFEKLNEIVRPICTVVPVCICICL